MLSIPIPRRLPREVIALGADLKCRPALARADSVTLFDEVGDLASPENQEALETLLESQSPEVILCDRHPGYYSTELAHRIADEKGIALHDVQHHRAHVAAVCLELGLYQETVVGLAFDGTGFGDDGMAWGGEFFVGSVASGFSRQAHFAVLPVPGGDAAVRAPWRIALALMMERGLDPSAIQNWITKLNIPLHDLELFRKGLRSGIALGRSTALGRWFDTASALLGLRTAAAFEAEPAIELQKSAERYSGDTSIDEWPYQIVPGPPMIIDFADLAQIAETKPEDRERLALAFHKSAAAATAEVARRLADSAGTKKIVASGGCFLNRLFDRLLAERLSACGLLYLKPQAMPPGDQAIALGQIALALSLLGE